MLELDETITEGLVREALEESGVTIEPIALTEVYKNMARDVVALVFRCRIHQPTPRSVGRGCRGRLAFA